MYSENDIFKEGVLIVDDEPAVRELWKLALEKAGFQNVFEASSGMECVSLLQSMKESVTIIILDIAMPDLNGIETVTHLVNVYHGIVGIIFCTAYGHFKTDGVGSENIMNLDYQVKTSDFSGLIESVKRNIPLVLQKREGIQTEFNTKTSTSLETIEKKLVDIEGKIDSFRPSLLKEIGKAVVISITLGLFVFIFLFFGLDDFLSGLLNR